VLGNTAYSDLLHIRALALHFQ